MTHTDQARQALADALHRGIAPLDPRWCDEAHRTGPAGYEQTQTRYEGASSIATQLGEGASALREIAAALRERTS